jgi:uncharacterized membrane protein YphA (DoxX/SURF4 family)
LGLIFYVIAATYIGHPVVWQLASDAFFRELMGQMKNLAMIGGLLALVAVGPGRLALQPDRDEAESGGEPAAKAKPRAAETSKAPEVSQTVA